MIDFIIVIFCLLCLIKGIFRGSVKEAISISGIFIGLLAASAFYQTSSRYVFSWIGNTPIRNLLGYLLIFGFCIIVFSFLALVVTYVLNIRVSSVGSRLAGAGIGTLKGIFLIAVLCIPLVTFLPKNYASIRNSTLFSLGAALSAEMVGLVPEDMQRGFKSHMGWYSMRAEQKQQCLSAF
jgi:membrane protein required for colicin V production